MRVLVVGGNGMLGSDLVVELKARGHEVKSPPRSELDITNPVSVAEITQTQEKADWCINCAAYTAVDKAEEEADEAMLVNGIAPGYLSQVCAMAQVRLLHVSTDFVFDGNATQPYGEEAPTAPQGAYARSKRHGEEAVLAASPSSLVARTAWLFGPNGNSFPKTMISAYRAGKQLKVVSDQFGTPTYTADLARVLVDLIEKEPFGGIYHTAGPEVMTWHDLATRAIGAYRFAAKADGPPPQILPITTEDWPTPAKRPQYSALSFAKMEALGVEPMRAVDVALLDFVQRVGW
jgi:dTDP-4-dehydrorhamnose reductase